jgi:hypothetical protein
MTISTEDRLAIHELISLHGHVVDDGDFSRLHEVFTVDVVYDLTACRCAPARKDQRCAAVRRESPSTCS